MAIPKVFLKASIFTLAASIAVGCVLQIIGLSTIHWVDCTAAVNGQKVDIHMGLWKECATSGNQTICISFSDYIAQGQLTPSKAKKKMIIWGFPIDPISNPLTLNFFFQLSK